MFNALKHTDRPMNAGQTPTLRDARTSKQAAKAEGSNMCGHRPDAPRWVPASSIGTPCTKAPNGCRAARPPNEAADTRIKGSDKPPTLTRAAAKAKADTERRAQPAHITLIFARRAGEFPGSPRGSRWRARRVKAWAGFAEWKRRPEWR